MGRGLGVNRGDIWYKWYISFGGLTERKGTRYRGMDVSRVAKGGDS